MLVTTLTKKMSEDLTDYLLEAGVKARYLHSEIDTLERIQIIRELRLGDYDVLVGVNLLREGLDLPEVSLVAILDADKEGFLRGKTALIQTIGRAARHVNGRVLMYADKMTEAIKGALDETNRRRAIAARLQRGARHDADLDREGRLRHRRVPRARAAARAEVAPPPRRRRRSRACRATSSRSSLITLEEEMFQAAEELRFEYAAKLRDEIKELRRDLNALVRGGGVNVGFVLAILLSAFITGALARFATPGPRPDAGVADDRDRPRSARSSARSSATRSRTATATWSRSSPSASRSRSSPRTGVFVQKRPVFGAGRADVPGARARRRALPRAAAEARHRPGQRCSPTRPQLPSARRLRRRC